MKQIAGGTPARTTYVVASLQLATPHNNDDCLKLFFSG